MMTAGALDGDDVLGLLDDADGRVVAPRVGADAALLGLGDVAALLAEADARLDLGEGRDEPGHVVGVGLQEVEGDALGALGTDPGESSELVDQVLHSAFVHTATLSPAIACCGPPHRSSVTKDVRGRRGEWGAGVGDRSG